jgi:hypothetical protein
MTLRDLSTPSLQELHEPDAFLRPVNSSSSILPTYTRASNPSPPAYNEAGSPTNVITPSQVVAHLRLLAAYARLQQEVGALAISCCHNRGLAETCGAPGCPGYLTTECKRALLVEMAVSRFNVWLKKLVAQGKTSIPPLDVLFIWSTYLGNPRS